MKAAEADSLARGLLREGRRAPRFANQRLALALALPREAEALRCTPGADLGLAARGLSQLWDALEEDELSARALGTPQLAAGCLEAAEILGGSLTPKVSSAQSFFPSGPVDFSSHEARVARPRVFALLSHAEPARVFYSMRPEQPPPDDDAIRDTVRLVQRFTLAGTPCWALDRPAPGRSKMAALFLRALLEQWPEALQRLTPDSSSQWDVPVFGVTGALDESGGALPAGELDSKVRGFFAKHPNGRLLVPTAQWREARKLFDELRPREELQSRYYAKRHWWQVQPFAGTLDLLVRLGIQAPGCEETLLFEKLRQSSRKVRCWNGGMRDVSETLALELSRRKPGKDESDAVEEEDLLREVRESWLSGCSRFAFIEGGPGSGKSIVLRRLSAHLLQETPLLGPALRVDARNVIQEGFSLERALHVASPSSLRSEEYTRLVELARSPAFSGSVWLLVDGLDEVSKENRDRLRELIVGWDGPSIVGARPLPNEIPGAPHVHVEPLDAHRQRQLFEFEGRSGHWQALAGEYGSAMPQADRRRQMVSDLCSTPLGVSLLAMLPEEELGGSLDVPAVLRKSIIALLDRAEKTGRIPASVRRKASSTSGLAVLGAAAWAMIRRGEATLTQEDLEGVQPLGPPELVDAVHEVLDNSDLVQRVGLDRYQFSHKSIAEFCAALYLMPKPGAEQELLPVLGEPGPDAVAFHFGSLATPERLSQWMRQLLGGSRRPLSSLALATRLLIANGPERVSLDVARAVLVKRVRFQSRRKYLGWRPSLPGGLGEDREMWLALERWARELRPHAHELIVACPPEVGQFLRGDPLPLEEGYSGYTLHMGDGELYTKLSFAQELVSALDLDLPLPVLVRWGGGVSRLLDRPVGPWALELEKLFDVPEESWSASRDRAVSVWVQRAPIKRQLERLDVLSRSSPVAALPLLETVRIHGSKPQKREALLRAAINSLEHGEYDEGDWQPEVSFARKLRGISSEELLKQWEFLWTCGLIGDTSERGKALEPLYAEFFDDPCGLARWRALMALARVHGSVDAGLLRRAVRDTCRAVRVEALSQLRGRDLLTGTAEIAASLASLDDAERWAAFAAIRAGRTAPIEWVLSALPQVHPPPARRSSDEDGHWASRSNIPREAPWQQALHRAGDEAHRHLMSELQRVQGSSELHTVLALLDGPYALGAEQLLDSIYIEEDVVQEVLATGGPRQRRFIARKCSYRSEALTLYVDDPDPEVAAQAREGLAREQQRIQFERERLARMEAERRRTASYGGDESKPVLSLDALSGYDSFDELWKALAGHWLPLHAESQLAYSQEEKRRSLDPDDSEDPIESVPSRQRKPFLQRLSQLYQPRHQPLLLEGLRDKHLAPFSIALLRDHLPSAEVLALIPQGGPLTEHAVEILSGTPHAPPAARLLREAVLSGRVKADEPDTSGDSYSHEMLQSMAHSHFVGWWLRCLEQLQGLVALLPLLAEPLPEGTRSSLLYQINSSWRDWERARAQSSELVEWARQEQRSQDEEVRIIALRLMGIVGSAEDAERWRPALARKELSPRVLAAAIWLVSRFGRESDLPVFRQLLDHSPEASSEAITALARVGGASVVEELVRIVESPPASLKRDRQLLLGAELSYWVPAAVETILRFGDGEQAKRAARVLEQNTGVWSLALKHFRLPEHVLFIVGHLRTKDPTGEEDNGYTEAQRVLAREVKQVDRRAVCRVMIEASFWGDYFRRAFENFLGSVDARDVDLLLARLREKPDDNLALSWLSQHPESEAALDAIWREEAVPWWA